MPLAPPPVRSTPARSSRRGFRENIIAVGNSGTGQTDIALGLALAACERGLAANFTTAATPVHELIEARDERRLLRLQRQLAAYKLLVINELGYVPLSQTGAELPLEVFSQRYGLGSTMVVSNLAFDEWTSVFASERPTGAASLTRRPRRFIIEHKQMTAHATSARFRGVEQPSDLSFSQKVLRPLVPVGRPSGGTFGIRPLGRPPSRPANSLMILSLVQATSNEMHLPYSGGRHSYLELNMNAEN